MFPNDILKKKIISDQEPVWFDLISHSNNCAVKFVLGTENSEDKLNPVLALVLCYCYCHLNLAPFYVVGFRVLCSSYALNTDPWDWAMVKHLGQLTTEAGLCFLLFVTECLIC